VQYVSAGYNEDLPLLEQRPQRNPRRPFLVIAGKNDPIVAACETNSISCWIAYRGKSPLVYWTLAIVSGEEASKTYSRQIILLVRAANISAAREFRHSFAIGVGQ